MCEGGAGVIQGEPSPLMKNILRNGVMENSLGQGPATTGLGLKALSLLACVFMVCVCVCRTYMGL